MQHIPILALYHGIPKAGPEDRPGPLRATKESLRALLTSGPEPVIFALLKVGALGFGAEGIKD